MLVDPARQEFVPGEDDQGEGTALNVRALYQRCPHLGCKPNPCLRNFWLECPCHGSRYDRLGIKADGAQYGPAPRAWTASRSRRRRRRADLDTSKITLGPLPVAVGQPGIIPPKSPSAAYDRSDRRPARRSPERPPARAPPVRGARPEPASASGSRRLADPGHRRAHPERAAKIVRQSGDARWVAFLGVTVVALFVIVYYFYEIGGPDRQPAAAPRGGGPVQQVTSPSSAATTSTRPTARAATASTARAASGRS